MDEESRLIAPSKASRGADVFLGFCRLLNFVTIISALLCLVAHCMAFAVGPNIFQVGNHAARDAVEA